LRVGPYLPARGNSIKPAILSTGPESGRDLKALLYTEARERSPRTGGRPIGSERPGLPQGPARALPRPGRRIRGGTYNPR